MSRPPLGPFGDLLGVSWTLVGRRRGLASDLGILGSGGTKVNVDRRFWLLAEAEQVWWTPGNLGGEVGTCQEYMSSPKGRRGAAEGQKRRGTMRKVGKRL